MLKLPTTRPLAMRPHLLPYALAGAALLALSSCSGSVPTGAPTDDGTNSRLESGRTIFRLDPIGTEGYWTDAVGLGTGLVTSGFTVLDALTLGMQFDAAAIPAATLSTITGELATDLTAVNTPTLRDAAVFIELLQSDAVIGLTPIDRNGDGSIDLLGADAVGVTCALCHSLADGFAFDGKAPMSPLAGSIGLRLDGPAPSQLDIGDLFALAENSRALYPYLPQSHATIGGEPISRTGAFIDTNATEAAVDALLRDDAAFPPGLWDMMPDGIGAPTVMSPVYDIRPSAPYGTAGEFPELKDAINAHVTLGLDPTTLLTPAGRVFLDRVGLGIGTELANEFELALDDAGIAPPIGGYPYVDALTTGASLTVLSPLGLRLNEDVLRDVATYLQSLNEPIAPAGDAAAIERGALLYGTTCLDCHGPLDDVSPQTMVPMIQLLPTYAPTTLLQRGFPFSFVLDDRLTTYDDRLVLFDQLYADIQVPSLGRSIAAPHLTGLFLRTMFLHDGSIPSLDTLLDSTRGSIAPHPVYVDGPERADLIEFLTRR